jgi:hypothetical protein
MNRHGGVRSFRVAPLNCDKQVCRRILCELSEAAGEWPEIRFTLPSVIAVITCITPSDADQGEGAGYGDRHLQAVDCLTIIGDTDPERDGPVVREGIDNASLQEE